MDETVLFAASLYAWIVIGAFIIHMRVSRSGEPNDFAEVFLFFLAFAGPFAFFIPINED